MQGLMDQLFTIGAYGFDGETFFQALQDAGVDLFLDVRRRRGIRGHEYAFGNANQLQQELAARGITYRHELDLAPTQATRTLQNQANRESRVAKRKQTVLADAFVEEYTRTTLEPFDWSTLIQELQQFQRPVLFCVERLPQACHRHLVADRLAEMTGTQILNLVPDSAN